jgi:hypothetical protein
VSGPGRPSFRWLVESVAVMDERDDQAAAIRVELREVMARLQEIDGWLPENAEGAHLSAPVQRIILAQVREIKRALERLLEELGDVDREE